MFILQRINLADTEKPFAILDDSDNVEEYITTGTMLQLLRLGHDIKGVNSFKDNVPTKVTSGAIFMGVSFKVSTTIQLGDTEIVVDNEDIATTETDIILPTTSIIMARIQKETAEEVSETTEEVAEPVTETIKEVTETTEVAEEVAEPVTETIKEVSEPVTETIKEVATDTNTQENTVGVLSANKNITEESVKDTSEQSISTQEQEITPTASYETILEEPIEGVVKGKRKVKDKKADKKAEKPTSTSAKDNSNTAKTDTISIADINKELSPYNMEIEIEANTSRVSTGILGIRNSKITACNSEFTYFIGDNIEVLLPNEVSQNFEVKDKLLGVLDKFLEFKDVNGNAVSLLRTCQCVEDRKILVYEAFAPELTPLEYRDTIILKRV